MRSFFAILCLLVVGVSMGQPVTRMWVRTTSLPLTDNYADMVQDSAGNTFICGSSANPTSSKYDMLVVKYDKNGVKQWEKTFPGTSGHSVAQAIALDPNGHVVVAGQTQWAPPADGLSRVIKVSAAGVLLWDKVGSATVGSYWYDVAVDKLGEVSTTGYINNGQKAMRTSHFLSNGTLAWNRDYSYPGLTAADQAGRYIKVDTDQNIYVCGVNNGFPGNTYNTVVKYSKTSTQAWMRHFMYGARDYPRGFAQLPGGKFAVVLETLYNLNQTSMYQVQILMDSNGVEQDRFVTGFTGSISIKGLSGDRDGSIFMGAIGTNNSVNHAFVTSIDPATNYQVYAFPSNAPPELRVISGGGGNGDFYIGCTGAGSGPRPATILGYHFIGSIHPNYTMWSAQIFGSTANGAVPYAIPKGILTDAKGDVFVMGDASGVGGFSDCFFVKYETGPVAVTDDYMFPPNQLFTSPPKGVLLNDHQISQATYAVLTQPQHGTLTAQADGSFSYMPNPGYTGPDSFTYKLTRSNSSVVRSSTGTVKLYIKIP